MSYEPSNWYWSGTPGVYGSARGGLVANPSTNTVYQAWLSAGNAPTPWPIDTTGAVTAAALDVVLESVGLPATSLAAPTQALLAAYANAKQWALATDGFTVTIASMARIFPTDVVSMGLITGKAARVGQPSPPATINWQFSDGFVSITAAEFLAAATQVADFVQATFDALEPILASIADGSTTTTTQVDAAAWPSNVSIVPIS